LVTDFQTEEGANEREETTKKTCDSTGAVLEPGWGSREPGLTVRRGCG